MQEELRLALNVSDMRGREISVYLLCSDNVTYANISEARDWVMHTVLVIPI